MVAVVPLLQFAVPFEVKSTRPIAAHVHPPAYDWQGSVWLVNTVALSVLADTIATWEISNAEARAKVGAMMEHIGLAAGQRYRLSDPFKLGWM